MLHDINPVLIIIISFVSVIVGYLDLLLTKKNIKSKLSKYPERNKFSPNMLNRKKYQILWMSIFIFSFILITLFSKNYVDLVFNLLVFSILISISFIDLSIRILPNLSLLLLIIVKIIYTLVDQLTQNCSTGSIKQSILNPIIGLVGGFVLYLLPRMLNVYIGGGDVKLSSVIGFILGFSGYIEAMLIMALINVIYLLVLIITKKGGLKTKAPMGPSLATGAILTLMFPVLTTINLI